MQPQLSPAHAHAAPPANSAPESRAGGAPAGARKGGGAGAPRVAQLPSRAGAGRGKAGVPNKKADRFADRAKNDAMLQHMMHKNF